MKISPPIHLTLFFTRNISLGTWDKTGMFEREVALYRRLQAHGFHVRFVTYGNSSDLDYAPRLPGITILCNRWNLPGRAYERLLPWLHAPAIQRTDIIKTNQTNGADIALRAAQLWHKPLIARCGYMWSAFLIQSGRPTNQIHHAQTIETRVFGAAQRVVVTTPTMAEDIAQRIPKAAARTVVIPNYVDTNVFCPSPPMQPAWDIIFIGRLQEEKNVGSLLEAITPLDVRLLLIGSGSLGESLKQRFVHLGPRVQWMDRVPNLELPSYLNRAHIAILPSFHEGHPKTLIEAMSCGLPVIGTDVPGIREILRHRENGYLCATSADAIRDAIQTVLKDATLCAQMGQNARQFVLQNFSLEQIVQQELAILQEAATR